MPSITSWTRLEPRARGNDMAPSLEARVHDPLWMLGRQWQVGEFQGEDAGSPVVARLRGRADTPTVWRAGATDDAPILPLNASIPLEALIEAEDPAPDLRLAAETGLHAVRMLKAAGFEGYAALLPAACELVAPIDADPSAARYVGLMAGRAPDGDVLAALVRTVGIPDELNVEPAQVGDVLSVLWGWVHWYDALVQRPAAGQSTWQASRVEYTGGVRVDVDGFPMEVSVAAYPGGALDWDDVGVCDSPPVPTTSSELIVTTSLASPATYPGMPVRRWWQFEDARINLANLEAAPEDLARMLVVEFATVYGNDWYLLPVEVPVGSLITVNSLVVLDTFGEVTLVERVLDPGWSMFELSTVSAATGREARWNRLFVPPTATGGLESEPIEEVLLARDEQANLAWGVERVVAGLTGDRIDRFAQWQARRAAQPVAETTTTVGPLSYRLAGEVPDHWIPLLAHELSPGRVELRRGAVRGPDGVPVQPAGRVLEPGRPLAFPLEEVPREGVRVTRSWQYARATDGSGVLWLGRRVTPGRGEASGGWSFDQLV